MTGVGAGATGVAEPESEEDGGWKDATEREETDIGGACQSGICSDPPTGGSKLTILFFFAQKVLSLVDRRLHNPLVLKSQLRAKPISQQIGRPPNNQP